MPGLETLQDGESVIIADGEALPGGRSFAKEGGAFTIMSNANLDEMEHQDDAIGVGKFGGIYCIALDDGISGYDESITAASEHVRGSLWFAAQQMEKNGDINPLLVNRAVRREFGIQRQDSIRRNIPIVSSGTVGAFIVIYPDWRIVIHHFGDPEFAIRSGSTGRVNVPDYNNNLLPQNGALQRYQALARSEKRHLTNEEIATILMPEEKNDRAITHALARHRECKYLSPWNQLLQLAPGDWFMACTDGAQLYKLRALYQAWFDQHPNATTSDLAEFASRMTMIGYDNGTGLFVRRDAVS